MSQLSHLVCQPFFTSAETIVPRYNNSTTRDDQGKSARACLSAFRHIRVIIGHIAHIRRRDLLLDVGQSTVGQVTDSQSMASGQPERLSMNGRGSKLAGTPSAMPPTMPVGNRGCHTI
jgi:hypothetical protein